MRLFKLIRKTVEEKDRKAKAKKAAIKAAETRRVNSIKEGKFKEIDVNLRLAKNEKAYYALDTQRYMDTLSLQSLTTTNSKKSGAVSGALIGGVIGGWTGAEIGTATLSKDRSEVETHTDISSASKLIDTGQLILTSQRILFTGRSVVSVPYQKLLRLEMFPGRSHHTITLLREDMPHGEFFYTTDNIRQDFLNYLEGIAKLHDGKLKTIDERD